MIYTFLFEYNMVVQPALVAQLYALSNWRPGGRGFNPRRGWQHSFVEINREIFSMVILPLPLIQEGHLSVSGERMCTILVNRLEDQACPVNVWLGKLTMLDMTPLGWLGRKTSTQTNKHGCITNRVYTLNPNNGVIKRLWSTLREFWHLYTNIYIYQITPSYLELWFLDNRQSNQRMSQGWLMYYLGCVYNVTRVTRLTDVLLRMCLQCHKVDMYYLGYYLGCVYNVTRLTDVLSRMCLQCHKVDWCNT